MRRTSKVIENLVDEINIISNRCYDVYSSKVFSDKVCDFSPIHIVAYIGLVHTNIALTAVARLLKYCVAKPIYHLENIFLKNEEN